jgi:hypothetical protein
MLLPPFNVLNLKEYFDLFILCTELARATETPLINPTPKAPHSLT